MRKALLNILSALLLTCLFAACENETYDTGDGKYSYMRADFAEIYTDSEARLVSAVTDDDETLTFDKPFSSERMNTPDSVYRVLLYYNKVGNSVKPVMLGNVIVPSVRKMSGVLDELNDPLHFDNSWVSRNGKYINLGITVKAGKNEGDTDKQLLAMAYNGVTDNEDGSKEVRMRVLHSQNGMPEYYSVQAYMSIPLSVFPYELKHGDRIVIDINTYDGEISKTFVL